MEHLESRKDLRRGGARREMQEWFMLWSMGGGTDQTGRLNRQGMVRGRVRGREGRSEIKMCLGVSPEETERLPQRGKGGA